MDLQNIAIYTVSYMSVTGYAQINKWKAKKKTRI